ncbi:MAG: transposase [Candidatus Nealsonbacteria bacterium]|nr:transposase [Candidatus Nealsonbacteria bacterium]
MRKVKFEPNNIYHIYNRGVDKRDIFLEDIDKWRCLQGLCLFNDEKNSSNILWQIEKNRGEVNLKILKDYVIKEGRSPLVRILAYSLMPNHYHLLVEELCKGGISKFMHKFGNGYAHYFNKKYQRSGSLFEGPFKAVLVENEIYLQYLLVYINVINPGQLVEPKLKEEGIKDMGAVIKTADECLWTTHQEYSGKRGSIIIDKGILGEIFPTPEKYRDFVKQILLDKKYQEITHLVLED